MNALRESGPLFADQAPTGAPAPSVHTIGPHSTYNWSVFTRDSPVLRYRPGCQHCTYKGEEQFQAVLAYAYLPSVDEAGSTMLRCGLRSKPVVMPPLQDSLAYRNSKGR